MRERSRVLTELRGAQPAYVADALYRARALVHREFLVPIHRQPFLQRQLEPVPAGYPVTRPVVEILVRDDGLDALVVGIRRGFRLRQHVFGVEDVQPLVLHRPHIEVRHGGDVEHVKVVFQPEHLLVPRHRFLERAHGVRAPVLVARAHPDRQRDLASGSRDEAVAHRDQTARDQREQVARFRMRICPDDPVPPVGQCLHRPRIAVRQHHRAGRRVGGEADGEPRHHVRPVGEIGDAAESLRLALGEEGAAGDIETRKFRVLRRRDRRLDLQNAGCRRIGDDQRSVLDPPAIGAERHTIDRDRMHQLPRTIEPQWCIRGGRGITPQREAGTHDRRLGIERESEIDRIHQERRRAIIGKPRLPRGGDGGGIVGVGHAAASGALDARPL